MDVSGVPTANKRDENLFLDWRGEREPFSLRGNNTLVGLRVEVVGSTQEETSHGPVLYNGADPYEKKTCQGRHLYSERILIIPPHPKRVT